MTGKVVWNGHWYEVGDWCFDPEDMDVAYIDRALEAWSRWRDYVVAHQAKGQM